MQGDRTAGCPGLRFTHSREPMWSWGSWSKAAPFNSTGIFRRYPIICLVISQLLTVYLGGLQSLFTHGTVLPLGKIVFSNPLCSWILLPKVESRIGARGTEVPLPFCMQHRVCAP